ncbi:hypothetical protein DFP72DRAFT_850335 [Ephemerocybe angulata]|uniref:Uncharacterized protein n=1 Tax=Ephemerocybe angulata TaxID=980116 RepID=A0A8H6HSX3_9AGAR|nr:hypothetical protein DFP72DRAFT_850335 [Tulosesus angulatus]
MSSTNTNTNTTLSASDSAASGRSTHLRLLQGQVKVETPEPEREDDAGRVVECPEDSEVEVIEVDTISYTADRDAATIRDLNAKIKELEASRTRIKKNLRNRCEALKDARDELTAVIHEVTELQKGADRQEEQLQSLRGEVDRYRGWWLNEYIFVKILLGLVPRPADVCVIAAASHSRYRTFCSPDAPQIDYNAADVPLESEFFGTGLLTLKRSERAAVGAQKGYRYSEPNAHCQRVHSNKQ